MLTVAEAAKLLGVGKTYVYDHYGYLVKSGRIAKVRLAAEILKEE
ncbi:MAG: helix-turn-helix domain-containing protein [Clostridia bacterium]|nr:helix-turn-helix domain-containing protein [Clostridia bacterium]